MKRRTFVQTAGGSALGLLGAGLPLLGHAQDRYAKYKGQTVVMSIPSHPHYDAMLKLLPEFTRQTGIKVETDRLAMARMKDKQLLEMAKPSGDYDLVCYVVMWKSEYVKKNLIREIEPLLEERGAGRPRVRLQGPDPALRRKHRPGRRTEGLPAGPGRQALRPALRRGDLHPGLPPRPVRKARPEAAHHLRASSRSCCRWCGRRPASAR